MGITSLEFDYTIQHKLKSANDLFSEGKHLHSIQIYLSLINDYPDHPEPYLKLAEMYEKLSMQESVAGLFDQVIEKHPESDELKFQYGKFLFRSKKWDDAVKILGKISPDDEPIVSYLLGCSYFILRDYELAKVNFLNFIISDEEPEIIHESYFYLAKIEIELNQYENALKYAEKTEVLFADHWELYLIYTKIYYHLDMYSHAAQSVEKAIRLNNKNTSVHAWAGKIYMKNKMYKKAEAHFISCIDLADSIASEDYANLAEAYLKSGKLKDAMHYFHKAVELDPENGNALEGKNNTSVLLRNKSSANLDG